MTTSESLKIPFHFLDLGFHYAVTPYLDHRFNEAFQIESVQLKVLNKVPFVIINSVAFEGDSCFLCSEAKEKLKMVESRLKVSYMRTNRIGSKLLA